MKKTSLAIGVVLAGIGLAGPALADCALEILRTKQQLEALPFYVSSKVKQSVQTEIAWAERAQKAKNEAECYEHVKRAREAMAK